MASAVARAYKGSLAAEPPAGSRSRAPGQGFRKEPPEAEALLVFGRSMEAANLPTFLTFESAQKSDICVILAKIMGSQKNWGKAEANLGGCAPSPGPGLKPPLSGVSSFNDFPAKQLNKTTTLCPQKHPQHFRL